MPTRLTRSVARETSAFVRTPRGARPLIVTLTDEGLYVRAKGTRTSYLLPYHTAWVQAARLFAAAQVAEKTARRRRRG